MTVRAPDPEPPRPDLVVESPSASDAVVAPGGRFTLTVKVRNRGAGEVSATTLRYYRSADAAISTSDVEARTAPVPSLPGGFALFGTSLEPPRSPGVYHYGACVDPVPNESDTTNNCSRAVPVEVQVPPARRPDLVALSASVSKTRLETGEAFTLSATVRNEGEGDAAASTLRHYLARRFGDGYNGDEVGAGAVEALAPSDGGRHSLTTNAPSDAFNLHYYRGLRGRRAARDRQDQQLYGLEALPPDQPAGSSGPGRLLGFWYSPWGRDSTGVRPFISHRP